MALDDHLPPYSVLWPNQLSFFDVPNVQGFEAVLKCQMTLSKILLEIQKRLNINKN